MCLAKDVDWFTGYVKSVAKARGEAAGRQLIADVKAQARLGNQGAPGDWRDNHKEDHDLR